MLLALCIAGSLVAILGAGCAQVPRGPEASGDMPKKTPIANVVISAPAGGVDLGVAAAPSKVGRRAGQGMAIGATVPAVAGLVLAFTPAGFLAMAAGGAVAVVTGAAGAATGALVGAAEDANSGRGEARGNAQASVERTGLARELTGALQHAALRECFRTELGSDGVQARVADSETFLDVEWNAVELAPQSGLDEEPRFAIRAAAWYSYRGSGLARRRGLVEQWAAPRSIAEWSADEARLARAELGAICRGIAASSLDEIDPGRTDRRIVKAPPKGA
jgi:hypothetical protein